MNRIFLDEYKGDDMNTEFTYVVYSPQNTEHLQDFNILTEIFNNEKENLREGTARPLEITKISEIAK